MALKGVLSIAGPFSDAAIKEINVCFSVMLGQEVELSIRRDDKLIGGFLATVDGKVYDSSILSRLKDIQRHMLEKE